MRNIVIGICSFSFLILLLMTGYTVAARQTRTNQLEAALNHAMQKIMENEDYPKANRPQSDEELVAMFEQLFISQLSAKATYKVSILDVDCEKGLLSVEVTQDYPHLNGQNGSITIQKTVIRDKLATDPLYGTCQVSYYLGDNIYRRYEQNAGEAIVVPRNPYAQDAVFLGWREKDTGMLYSKKQLAEVVLKADMEFVAEYDKSK